MNQGTRLGAGVRLFVTLCVLTCLQITAKAGGVVTSCTEFDFAAQVAGGGTVTFTCTGTISVSGPQTITTNTVIDGAGHSITLDGQAWAQIFIVNSGATLTLRNLTLSNGNVSADGGAIYN